ncbi:3-hydroxyacyl-CoA dehydrogenase NAD-binding domain-containing protein [Klebsiella pneumoniae]|nr:3-hydroxyacyl-CoA dehydrogenase NAD-binding domain-containing protein [Klebsiella pneumoniae]
MLNRDVVIEAVFEDLALKQRMVSEVEQYGGPQTISLASNTSMLPIGDIAVPSRQPPGAGVSACIFSVPWKKCRWLRWIPHKGTDLQTIATVVQLAKRQGKTPIACRR